MDVNAIIDLVGSLGFPVIMCFFLIDYIKDRDTKMQDSFDKMTEAFTEFKQMLIDLKGGQNND